MEGTSTTSSTNNNDGDDMEICNLEDMDASTYLAYASAQASRLPFISVAPAKKHDSAVENPKGDSNDTATTTTATTAATTTTFTINEKATSCPKHPNTNPNVSTGAGGNYDTNDDGNEAMRQGSASSVQYLYSRRLKLIPPPSLYHFLPPITIIIVTKSSKFKSTTSTTMEEYAHSIMDNFSKLRLYLHQCCEDSASGLKEGKVPVPPSRDGDSWQIFCLGKDEACGKTNNDYYASSTNHHYDVSLSPSSS